jgi:hypothetical protein
MPLYGRNVQGVTANSSTTNESTTGAPLGTWAQVKGGDTGTITPANNPNSHFGNTSAGTRANVDVQMYGNDTPSAFVSGQAVGVFGVTSTQMQNNVTNAVKDHPAHAGWVLRRAGTGPVIGGTVTAPGGTFANGETITVSNATVVNATLVVSTNATGNATSVSVRSGGSGFTNTSMALITFNREKHVANVTGTAAGVGYSNGDLIVMSNTTNVVVPASFVIATNATGGIVNGSMLNTSNSLNNVGLFLNAQLAAGLVFTVTNSSGGANTGNGTVTALAAAVINSTGGTVTLTLGGRAGRTHTETLIAAGSIGAQSSGYGTAATSNGSNSGTTSQLYYPGP